jgi:hypothetical protein
VRIVQGRIGLLAMIIAYCISAISSSTLAFLGHTGECRPNSEFSAAQNASNSDRFRTICCAFCRRCCLCRVRGIFRRHRARAPLKATRPRHLDRFERDEPAACASTSVRWMAPYLTLFPAGTSSSVGVASSLVHVFLVVGWSGNQHLDRPYRR